MNKAMAISEIRLDTVHPAAAVFPMHSEPQLQELAAHIKEHGLIDPIMLGTWMDDDDQLIEGIIDGRNRLKACEIAGVEPRYDKLKKGLDPVAYIVGKNLCRRDMTAGQKAIAYAFIYERAFETEGGRGRKGLDSKPFSKTALSQARAIVEWSRTKAADILSGALPFDHVLKEMNGEAEKSRGNTAADRILRKLERAT